MFPDRYLEDFPVEKWVIPLDQAQYAETRMKERFTWRSHGLVNVCDRRGYSGGFPSIPQSAGSMTATQMHAPNYTMAPQQQQYQAHPQMQPQASYGRQIGYGQHSYGPQPQYGQQTQQHMHPAQQNRPMQPQNSVKIRAQPLQQTMIQNTTPQSNMPVQSVTTQPANGSRPGSSKYVCVRPG